MIPETEGASGGRGRQLIWGLAAAAIIVAIIVVPPCLLVVTVGNPWPDSGVSLDRPLGTDATFGILAVVVWLGWAQFLVCAVVEGMAAVGERRARRVPIAFGVQQDLARKLVVAVLAALAAAPAIGTTASAAAAPTDIGLQSRLVDAVVDVERGSPEPGSPDAEHPAALAPPLRSVAVERMDSLWSIAERELGAGDRWTEIADLNDGRVMSDGTTFGPNGQLQPGWHLLVPASWPPGGAVERTSTQAGAPSDAVPRDDGTSRHVVQPGETLWDIAQETVGDAARYPELYDATRGRPQPGGRTLDHPDHIEAGWIINIPAHIEEPTSESDSGVPPDLDSSRRDLSAEGLPDLTVDDRGADGAGEPGHPGPDPARSGPATDESLRPPATEADVGELVNRLGFAHAGNEDGVGASVEITALRALVATATLLAAGAFAALTVNRARQLRHRRPGRSLPPMDVSAGMVEHAVTAAGPEAAATAGWLDRALRQLAAVCLRDGLPLPDVGAVCLGEHAVTLHLVAPAATPPPGPWRGSGDHTWSLDRTVEMSDKWEVLPAPYPALVSVGRDGGGATWILDAEATGGIAVAEATDAVGAGAGDAVRGVLRFMIAELALNRWAVGTRVHVAHDLGRSVARLNPDRVKVADVDVALAALEKVRRNEVDSRAAMALEPLELRLASPDSAGPVVVVLPDADGVDPRPDGRSRGIVLSNRVSTGASETSHLGRTFLQLTQPGRARIERWGVDLIEVFVLGERQATDLGHLLASTSTTRDVAFPPCQPVTPIAAAMRVDGAALAAPERSSTAERGDSAGESVPAKSPKNGRSLLPDSPAVYVERAATTVEDVERLGEALSEQDADRILALDPTLDADVTAWHDPHSTRPKIQVHGPVVVRACGEAVRNIGGTTEFLIYLACHQSGVTSERAAVALEWSEATVHNRARDARTLLGSHPDGDDWLPDATRTPAARERGVPIYQLHTDVLFSADLFRRLRLRAQARGAAGIDDLVTALDLVEGRPFDALRRRGYGWLFTEEPLQHHLTAAVVDCAHIIATRFVTEGDLERARWACEVAIRADEYSDVPRLDIAVIEAVINRGDVDLSGLELGDEDPSKRTEWITSRAVK